MAQNAILDFEWRDIRDEKGQLIGMDEYTFRLPDGMTPQGCKDFLDGLGWENDIAIDPGHPRLNFRMGVDVGDFYYVPEELSRDEVVAMLEAKGFVRVDNHQDHLDTL